MAPGIVTMNVKELTELAFQKSGETSFRSFAKRLGVSHVTIIRWIDGSRYPTFENAVELALLAELPLIKTASEVRMLSPDNCKRKKVLRMLASIATCMLVGLTLTPTVQAEKQAQTLSTSIYYAKFSKGFKRLWNGCLKFLENYRRPHQSFITVPAAR